MLPIRKVVLYKHGVGYFERQGTVRGDAALDLHFRASEMNDVLKSLTTLDLTDGHIASISYESTTPLAKQLEDIAIRLPDANSVSGLLAEIKGARLAVTIAGQRVEGVCAGIETVTRQDGDTVWHRQHLALLVDGAALRTFDLQEVGHVEFLDEGLRKDLQHLLAVLIGAKKKDLKKLTIYAEGKGERQILASYIVETPVWKTSYRVLLADEKKAPLIQGWALVDNTQDEDWEGVALSLVAGLPISFIHDLYSPRWKRRPVVEVREEEAYAPPVLEQAVASVDADALEETEAYASEAAGAPAAAPMRSAKRMRGEMAEERSRARGRSVQVQTRTVEVGDLFEYAIQNPVTVKRNQSALVPILQGDFKGKRVAVYNREVREKNPMTALLFTNSTGVTLEGGPLTVMEDETYVGEAMLDTMKPDEERLVPYSVELGCVITLDHRSRLEDVRQARIVHGTLYLYRYRIEQTIYVLKNNGDRPLDLFLEHRFRPGWKLEDTPDPVERTESFYRFRVEVPKKSERKFTVSEKGDEDQSFALSGVDRDTVAAWLKARYIDAATRKLLLDLVALQEQIGDLDRRIGEHEQRIQEIFADQERQRENLKALRDTGQEKALREKYVGELTRAEEQIKALREQIGKWKAEKAAAEKELRKRVGEIKFEASL